MPCASALLMHRMRNCWSDFFELEHLLVTRKY